MMARSRLLISMPHSRVIKCAPWSRTASNGNRRAAYKQAASWDRYRSMQLRFLLASSCLISEGCTCASGGDASRPSQTTAHLQHDEAAAHPVGQLLRMLWRRQDVISAVDHLLSIKCRVREASQIQRASACHMLPCWRSNGWKKPRNGNRPSRAPEPTPVWNMWRASALQTHGRRCCGAR